MPELPEVENVGRHLIRKIRGYRFEKIRINRLDVLKSARTTPANREARLGVGGRLDTFHRHGKRLALEFDDGRVIEFSLGMSGHLIVEAIGSEETRDHAHLIWTVRHPRNGRTRRLIWRDPRRFGGVWAWVDMKTMIDQKWGSIGDDALQVKYESFRDVIKGTRRSIKTALLDQNLIAGIGNIYADEALHRAGIRPRRMASRLRRSETKSLHKAVQEILIEAIEAGGSTIQSFKDPEGGSGRYQSAHAVYGRSGESCHSCGAVIRSMVLNGRTTAWCSECQK